MKIYNTIDELKRFVEFNATLEYGTQQDTHTISYLYAREELKKLGEVMGLEKLI